MYHAFLPVLESALGIVMYQRMPVLMLLKFMKLYLAPIHMCGESGMEVLSL
jgi:hypothetical protein